MLTKLLTSNSLKSTLLFCILLFQFNLKAQDTIKQQLNDSLIIVVDTLTLDTSKTKSSSSTIESKVEYSANDSIRFDLKEQKVYLYKDDDIKYEEINLKADYVEIDFSKNLVFAKGVADSTGKEIGTPVFTEGGHSFKSKTITYNFTTKKGLIKKVITQDGEGYLHGEVIKKMPNDNINIKKGAYTTCSLEHPHFEFRYYKSKVIPDNKIVTGPAYLVIENVPTPLFIPFGLFPNKKGQRSGIVIPTYGEAENRGFYFENGGYYFAINDYIDLKLIGDIYTRGSWAVKPSTNYRKRYKFNGMVNFNYAINYTGDKGSDKYKKEKDFSFRWFHNQDPKARPNSKFSANVNIVSSGYNTFNPTSTEAYLSNTFQSSINYAKTWADKYRLNVNLNHSQNTITKMVDLTLPQLTFSVDRFYPLRKKLKVGQLKWYDNISVNYSMKAENKVSSPDSLLFDEDFMKKFRNGVKHSVQVSSGSIKLFKKLVLTNPINLTERWYFESIRKKWSNDTLFSDNDTIVGYLKTDTIYGFQRAMDYNFGSTVSTTLYGMFSFKKGPVKAIRHVLKPTISFTYTPDFGTEKWGYYKYYTDDVGNENKYSIFQNGIYGKPPDGKSGRVGFSLSNNLEMKVRSRKDTVTGTKKIVLIERFAISTSYDIAKDSLNWSKISMNGNTRLFKNLNLTYSSF